LDYDAQLNNYAKLPLNAKDSSDGKPITDVKRVAQIWVEGERLVRHYASPESAFGDLAKLEKSGKKIRVAYAQDHDSGIKLLAGDAWFVASGKDTVDAFLLKDAAEAFAKKSNGKVLDFAAVKASVTR
jgi:NitT/TauT family transport system substrate-binding protein